LRGAALALLASFAILGAIACGGGNDDDGGSAPAATAADLIPDLSGGGFTMAETGRVPGATTAQDAHYAVFGKAGPVSSVRVEVNMHPDVGAATKQYSTISEALRNPPPDLFGPNATQRDNEAVYQADQSRSYVTTKPDGQGNLVYTDAYRFGRAVVIVYMISSDPAEAAKIRKDIAERMAKKAPD